MNPVTKRISKGLAAWRRAGARVDFLRKNNISVPRIWLGANTGKTILIQSGLHLEETSGPLLLLDPSALLPTVRSALKRDISFLIYPVVNNFGLRHDPSGPDKLLRYNEKGINYNDGWGLSDDKKCLEVKLVEEDILKFLGTNKVILAVSLHEDSTTPQKGYLWFNGIKSTKVRKEIRARLKSKILKSGLLKIDRQILLTIRESKVDGGRVEGGFTVVDAKDKGALEHWLGEDLKIPTVLSEAPFGLRLRTRKSFHSKVIDSAISTVLANFFNSRF